MGLANPGREKLAASCHAKIRCALFRCGDVAGLNADLLLDLFHMPVRVLDSELLVCQFLLGQVKGYSTDHSLHAFSPS
jgi:hypothetical protein